MPATETSHIRRDAQGRAWIDDRNVKVNQMKQIRQILFKYNLTGD